MSDRQVYWTACAIMAAIIVGTLLIAGADAFTHLP